MPTSGGYTPPAAPPCAYSPRMTRAAALALRTAGTLNENCIVVITDGPTIGTAGNTSVTEITLQPTSPTELSMLAEVNTTFDNVSWRGTYDIDTNVFIRLADNQGNIVQDIEGTTIASQFPWHLSSIPGGNFRDNYIEDCTLTGWATQIGLVHQNKFLESNINLTGKTSGTISQSSYDQCNITSGAAAYNAVRSTFSFHTYSQAGTGALTLCNDSEFSTVNIVRAAGSIGAISIQRSRFVASGTITQAAGAGVGTMDIQDTEWKFSNLTQNGPGILNLLRVDMTSANVSNTVAATRGLSINDTLLYQATVSEQRTINAAFDSIVDSRISGQSVVNSLGAAGGGGNTSILDGTTVDEQSTINLTDVPSGVDVGNCHIGQQSTLNVQAGGFINRSRIGANATVNTGAFGHDQLVIELAGTHTLTAANTNRQRTKGFSDLI